MPLSPTAIEYIINRDTTPGVNWRIFSGCENWRNGVCGGGGQEFNCWAKRLVEGRLKRHYPFGFEPTFYPEHLSEPGDVRKPTTIAVSFMGDLFGDWPEARVYQAPPFAPYTIPMFRVQEAVLDTVRRYAWHTFLFLTKCPHNLSAWNPWPDNAWVGVTATDSITFAAAYYHLAQVQAKTKYISLEPLLNWDMRTTDPMIHQASQAGVRWIILGAATKPYRPPQISAVREIEAACKKVGIALWIKDNLRPLLGDRLRQERPKGE